MLTDKYLGFNATLILYPVSFGDGVQQDKTKGAEFYKRAAMQAFVLARHNLGGCEGQKGNYYRAVRHLLISAKMTSSKALYDLCENGRQ